MLNLWIIRIFTFLLWAIAAGSATFWALKDVATTSNASASHLKTASTSATLADTQNLTPKVALALGAKNLMPPTAAGLASALQARFQLQGVLAVGSQSGAALISVDGKPAKPYRVGSNVDDNLQVIALKGRNASLGENGVIAFTLELPIKSGTNQVKHQSANQSMGRYATPSTPPPPPPIPSTAPSTPAFTEPPIATSTAQNPS